jgi:hypothetical protein
MRSEVRELKEQVREHQAMLQAILDSMGRAAVSLDWRNAHSSFVNSANNNYNSGGSLGSAAFNAEFASNAFRFPMQTGSTHHSNFNNLNMNNNHTNQNNNTRRNRRRDYSTTHNAPHEASFGANRRQAPFGVNP